MKQWRILQIVSLELSKFARSRITPPINTLVDMDKKLPLSHKARMHESVEQSDIKNESGREIESKSNMYVIYLIHSGQKTKLYLLMLSYESVTAAICCPCQPMYLWAVIFVISHILRVWLLWFAAKCVIVSCELPDLIPGISQHFVSTVVMNENTHI